MLKSSLTPPVIDQATIDRYVARGKRARSRAFADAIRALFSRPEAVSTPAAREIARKACTAC